MRNTNRKDCNGLSIFVGDYVVRWTGACKWEGKRKEIFMVSDIVIIEDKNSDIYSLGGLYNKWESKDVWKITKGEFKKMNISLRTDYFELKNGEYIECTDQHIMGLNEKEWKNYLFNKECFLFLDFNKK